ELTRERFVTDPLIAADGTRWYRTGDVGRWTTGGELECLGRNDFQVKIHGFRIELGEIESVLTNHPAVRQAVVVTLKDPTGETRLVAYLVAPHAPDAAVLRFYLQQKLPAYMIPQSFVFLDVFPLTGSGKVDRKSLPAAPQERTERRPPRTEVERVLAREFESLLEIPGVGLDDDFFALGGHSLLAQRLASRVRAQWPIELPLRVVFTSPTLESLARFVESELGALAPPSSQAIEFEEYTL
ncbi:MAG TPA: phosphopantetheine-binding protein, partial [Polyangiaceae bacterium]|nr:phosphopantetheine-binding protein [Polyangiaceae bacterium]